MVTRPGYDINLDLVNSPVRERIVDLRGSKQIPRVVNEAVGEKIFISDAVMLEYSATEIRRAVLEDDWNQLTRLVRPSWRLHRKYGYTENRKAYSTATERIAASICAFDQDATESESRRGTRREILGALQLQ